MTIEQIQKVVDTFFELCTTIGIQFPELPPLIVCIQDGDVVLRLNNWLERQKLAAKMTREMFRKEQATIRYANLLHALRYWDRSQRCQAVRFVKEITEVGIKEAIDFVDMAWKNNL